MSEMGSAAAPTKSVELGNHSVNGCFTERREVQA